MFFMIGEPGSLGFPSLGQRAIAGIGPVMPEAREAYEAADFRKAVQNDAEMRGRGKPA